MKMSIFVLCHQLTLYARLLFVEKYQDWTLGQGTSVDPIVLEDDDDEDEDGVYVTGKAVSVQLIARAPK